MPLVSIPATLRAALVPLRKRHRIFGFDDVDWRVFGSRDTPKTGTAWQA